MIEKNIFFHVSLPSNDSVPVCELDNGIQNGRWDLAKSHGPLNIDLKFGTCLHVILAVETFGFEIISWHGVLLRRQKTTQMQKARVSFELL